MRFYFACARRVCRALFLRRFCGTSKSGLVSIGEKESVPAANFFAAERRFAEPERDLVRNNFRRIERFLESRPLLRGFAGTRVWNLVLNGKIDSEFLII